MATAVKKSELADTLIRGLSGGSPQKCVLLIEDSEEAMFMVRCAIHEHGKGAYRLEWVEGLSEGIERLLKGGVDLVLLDLGLPDSSGPASYAWVRESAPMVPVLVLTGDTREQTELTIAASGVEDYLIKDEVSGSLLMQAIRAALYISRRNDTKMLREVKMPAPKNDSSNNSDKNAPEPAAIRSFVPFGADCQN